MNHRRAYEDRKIKVLLILHILRPGGAPKIGIEAFEALNDALDTRGISLGGGEWEDRFRKLHPLYVCIPDRSGSNVLRIMKLLGKRIGTALQSTKLRSWKPDVIYFNGVYSLGMVDYLRRLPKAPVILHVHETGLLLDGAAKQYSSLLTNLPNRYIAVTQDVREKLMSYGVPADKISVIGNFVDRRYLELNEKELSCRNEFVVGGCGYISWFKGDVLWLQMVKELTQMQIGNQIKFMWCGVGEKADDIYFREMARKLGIEKRIEFLPQRNDLTDFYRNADVIAVTSWEESFSLVALESMAAGTPVTCFANSGGTPEVVEDGGIVISEFSPKLMAEAIAGLAQDRERLAELSKKAQQRARSYFTPQQQISRLYDEIERVACDGR